MSKIVTIERFIERAKTKHGDRYDYSKAIRSLDDNNVIIICPIHGEFKQYWYHHLRGSGCKRCSLHKSLSSIRKRTKIFPARQTWLTTSKFISKAKDIHGNRYDYNLSNYINWNTKIKIICFVHGIFEQTPSLHLSGAGCRKCANYERGLKKTKKAAESFITRAIEIHGNKYNYSEAVFTTCSLKVKIICPKHGPFHITPNSHLRGAGCDPCGTIRTANKSRSSTKVFIERARKIHGNKFDYSLVVYHSNHEKIKLICKKHGTFETLSATHLKGKYGGCRSCGLNMPLHNATFTEKACKLYGNRYNYSKVNYINSQTKVTIICAEHGEFKKTPNKHLYGEQGCPWCVNIRNSRGMRQIDKWLKLNNIPFKREQTFEDLRSPKTNKQLKFDFYIPHLKLFIEYDGEQHYKPNKTWNRNNSNIFINDKFKNDWILSHNYTLLRIRYDDRKNINHILYHRLIAEHKKNYKINLEFNRSIWG